MIKVPFEELILDAVVLPMNRDENYMYFQIKLESRSTFFLYMSHGGKQWKCLEKDAIPSTLIQAIGQQIEAHYL